MRRLVGGVAVLVALLVVGAPAAESATLDGGCVGSATSFDEDGAELSRVAVPGEGGTKGDPFIVDPDGTVTYEGSTPQAFHDHSWHVDLMGVTVKSGGSANGNDESETSGEVQVDDYLPVSAVGLFKVSGGITADEGACDGSLWVKVAGSPVGTLPWIAGVGTAVVGAAGLTGLVLPLLRKGV